MPASIAIPIYTLNFSFLQTLTKMNTITYFKNFQQSEQLTKCILISFSILHYLFKNIHFLTHFSMVCFRFLIFKKQKIHKAQTHTVTQFTVFPPLTFTYQIQLMVFWYTVLYFPFNKIYSSLHLLFLLG